jgi:hypothetical protein
MNFHRCVKLICSKLQQLFTMMKLQWAKKKSGNTNAEEIIGTKNDLLVQLRVAVQGFEVFFKVRLGCNRKVKMFFVAHRNIGGIGKVPGI